MGEVDGGEGEAVGLRLQEEPVMFSGGENFASTIPDFCCVPGLLS